jgi:tRNA A37 threonylcarbamoyltransferase TsaD
MKQLLSTLSMERPIVLSGGVASNRVVKDFLVKALPEKSLYFAVPDYSRDNAFGVSELGRQMFFKEQDVC